MPLPICSNRHLCQNPQWYFLNLKTIIQPNLLLATTQNARIKWSLDLVQVDLTSLASEASFFTLIIFNEGLFWKSKWSPMGGGHFWESTHSVAWFLDVQDRSQPLRFSDVMNMTRHTEYIRQEREREAKEPRMTLDVWGSGYSHEDSSGRGGGRGAY